MRTIALAFIATIFSYQAHAVVDMKNANFADTWTDLIVPGAGYDLRVQRTYNSRSLFNGIFGFGWCSDFETKLEVTPEGNMKLTECGGGMELTYTPKGFDKKQVDKTIGTIVSEVKKRNKSLSKEYFAGLEKELKDNTFLREEFARQLKLKAEVKKGTVFYANGRETETIVLKGTTYTRTLPDGTYQKFDKDGNLTHMYDRNGNYLKIDHSGDVISSVTDNNGRKLTFKYNPTTKKVAAILGPNGMKAEYVSKGEDLRKVTNAWGNAFSYDYDDLHNLTKIVFPDKTHKALTYNKEKDWVTSFRNRKGCLETYDYEVDKESPQDHYWSKVVKKCGKKVTNQSTYEFFHRPRRDGTGKFLYRVRSDNNGNITDIVYHEIFGKPITMIRNQDKTQYTYYDNGLVRTKKEKLRQMTFSYKNSCRKVSDVAVRYVDPTPSKKKKASAKIVKTSFVYDKKKCNLIFAKNSEGQTVALEYDNRGRIEVIKDQSRKVVKIKYEERFGKPAVVTRPGLGTIMVSYKSDGQIEKVNSKEGPTVAVQVASIFNNLLDIIAPATAETAL